MILLRVDLVGARFNTTKLGEHIILESKSRLSVGRSLCTLASLLPNVQTSIQKISDNTTLLGIGKSVTQAIGLPYQAMNASI